VEQLKRGTAVETVERVEAVEHLKRQKAFLPELGLIFRTFFPGKISGKIPRKIFPKKCWEKMVFSAEKV
jgi:hypothetical protein